MARNGHTPTYKINIKTTHETATFIHVTKEMAMDWMENHNPLNRGLRANLADRYARDRVADNWLTTHQAIAFDTNGHMIDGQHRCTMVIKTGLTTKILVVTGLVPNVRMVTDIGAKRSPADVLQLIGRRDATMRDVAVVRQMMNGLGKRASVPEIVEAYDLHQEAANAAMALFPKQNIRNITIAPVFGPIARAWYTEDVSKLEEFAEVLAGGMGHKGRKGNKSVILLRNYLGGLPHRGEGLSRLIYGYTESALNAFLVNEALTELIIPEEELFPMPEKFTKAKTRKTKLRVVDVPKTLAKTA